jgi:hypothetical protein
MHATDARELREISEVHAKDARRSINEGID